MFCKIMDLYMHESCTNAVLNENTWIHENKTGTWRILLEIYGCMYLCIYPSCLAFQYTDTSLILENTKFLFSYFVVIWFVNFFFNLFNFDMFISWENCNLVFKYYNLNLLVLNIWNCILSVCEKSSMRLHIFLKVIFNYHVNFHILICKFFYFFFL